MSNHGEETAAPAGRSAGRADDGLGWVRESFDTLYAAVERLRSDLDRQRMLIEQIAETLATRQEYEGQITDLATGLPNTVGRAVAAALDARAKGERDAAGEQPAWVDDLIRRLTRLEAGGARRDNHAHAPAPAAGGTPPRAPRRLKRLG